MANSASPFYWVEEWKSHLSVGFGALTSILGLIELFGSGASCKIAGLLQILAGLIIVGIDGPMIAQPLAFAAPAGAILDSKPPYFKVALYAALTVLPAFTGCFKGMMLGFIASALATAVHAVSNLMKDRSIEVTLDSPPGQANQPGNGPYSP